MLPEWIRLWVSSGARVLPNVSSNNNPSSIYVTNLIGLFVSFFLAIQVPFYLSSGLYEHQIKVTLIIPHVTALFLIPIINGRHYHLAASLLLYFIYGSYIFFQADTHLFFLLGLFIIPFIFPSRRYDLKLILSSLYIGAFLLIEWPSNMISITGDITPDIKPINRIIFAVTCFIAAVQVHRITSVSWRKENRERARSESLLSNVLPTSIAKTLKRSQQAITHYHSSATIVFADIEGFTHLSNQLTPMDLVKLLDEIFSIFDEVCESYHLEKIKTIGDGYMVVGGLDEKNVNHPVVACLCAKEMRRAYNEFSTKHNLTHGLRIGINTGPVVSGVIGKSKYTFDVWGDAVNLAARMQSHGETDKIQVSETTFSLTQKVFDFSSKRHLFIKGMGNMQAYWLIDQPLEPPWR